MECTITVTENAREKVTELLEAAPDMSAVRIFVQGGGCAGMQHSMTFADKKEERDIEFAPKFYIDPVAIHFMDGATIDYENDGFHESFVFHDVFKAQGGSGTCGGCGAATGPGYEPH